MAVHRSAWADHHVKAARHSGKSSAAGRVATARNRQAAHLCAGDLGLIRVAATSLLGDVVGAVMLFRRGLSCNGNHENGERECQSFHEDLCLCVFDSGTQEAQARSIAAM